MRYFNHICKIKYLGEDVCKLQNDHCFPSILQFSKENNPNQKHTRNRMLGTIVEPSQDDTPETISEKLSNSVGQCSIPRNRIHASLFKQKEIYYKIMNGFQSYWENWIKKKLWAEFWGAIAMPQKQTTERLSAPFKIKKPPNWKVLNSSGTKPPQPHFPGETPEATPICPWTHFCFLLSLTALNGWDLLRSWRREICTCVSVTPS